MLTKTKDRILSVYSAVFGLVMTNFGMMGLLIYKLLPNPIPVRVFSFGMVLLGLAALVVAYGAWNWRPWMERYGLMLYGMVIGYFAIAITPFGLGVPHKPIPIILVTVAIAAAALSILHVVRRTADENAGNTTDRKKSTA